MIDKKSAKEQYREAYKLVRWLDHISEWKNHDLYASDHGRGVSWEAWHWMAGGVEYVTLRKMDKISPQFLDAAWTSFHRSSWKNTFDRDWGYYKYRLWSSDIPF